MPVYDLREMPGEVVTPKHSTAFGPLITGEQIELGLLFYKAGEGAKEHAHPHEQIIVVLRGEAEFTLDGVPHRLTPGKAVHVPPNVPHSVRMIADTEFISAKGVLDGVAHRI